MYRVTGRGSAGIAMYILHGIVFFAIGIFWLYVFIKEGGGFSMVAFLIFIWVVNALLVLATYLSSRSKTIEIDGLSIRFYIGDKLKKDIALFNVKEVGTISLRGKTPRGEFYLKGEKGLLLHLNWRDDMERDKLMKAFNELLKYADEYKFKIYDPLKWRGKKISDKKRSPKPKNQYYK